MAKTYKTSVLSVYDENGNKISIPAIKGDDYVLTEEDKAEIVASVLSNFTDVSEVAL